MKFLSFSQIFAIVGLLICLAGIGVQIRSILNRPFKNDLSRPQGEVRRGILYAFTLGMAPWEKESTKIHWIAYLRGIFLHIGIFIGLLVVITIPWLSLIPVWLIYLISVITGLGAIFGFIGIYMRLTGENERVLSLPDDYVSIVLTSLFLILTTLVLLIPGVLPYLYFLTAILLIYIPLSKIRHCVYFFYSKFFFGRHFGHRGVIGQSESKYSK